MRKILGANLKREGSIRQLAQCAHTAGWRRAGSLTWLALWSTQPLLAVAHGDLHTRVADLTLRLTHEPANAALYLKRGDLHRQHHAWQAALHDFERAAGLDPGLTVVELLRGLTFFEAGQPEQAKPALDRFLTTHSEHTEALITRARTLVQLSAPLTAVADFTRAIALRPNPEFYLERAQALAAAGAAHLDEALRGLDEGQANLGTLVTLQQLAIELELKQARVDAALTRLAQLATTTAPQETWLARRGEILELAGRRAAAYDAFAAALVALEPLSGHYRQKKAMTALEMRLRAALERLHPQGVNDAHQGDAPEDDTHTCNANTTVEAGRRRAVAAGQCGLRHAARPCRPDRDPRPLLADGHAHQSCGTMAYEYRQ